MQEAITRPMLGSTDAIIAIDKNDPLCKKLRFPLLATPKLDGIRCVKVKGKALTRTFKALPNLHVREIIERDLPDNLDVEIVSGTFNSTQSAVMSGDGQPSFKLYVLDYVKTLLSVPYEIRMKDLQALTLPSYCIKLVPTLIHDIGALKEYMDVVLMAGYEGVILRDPKSVYKCGRGTLTKNDMVKVKPFVDAEAVIIDAVEMMENTNEKEEDNFGNSKRSQAQDGMVPKGLLGKWIVKGINGQFKDVVFGLGSAKGVTMTEREEWWKNRKKYIGKIVTYKYQAHGSKDAPRLPIFKGFRSEEDM